MCVVSKNDSRSQQKCKSLGGQVLTVGRQEAAAGDGAIRNTDDCGHGTLMNNSVETATKSQFGAGAFRDSAPRIRSVGRAARSRAQPYVLSVLIAGCVVLALSIGELRAGQPNSQWWALVALTLISGSAVLKLPTISANFSISDVFTLTAAVVFGPAAGTVIVAIDSLVISRRLAVNVLPMQRILFNAAAPPVAMWLSAVTFFYASGLQPLSVQFQRVEVVAPWLLLFAGMYFLLNTFAIAIAIALHEQVSTLAIWRAHFQNLWVTFIGGAVGAGFVVFALQFGTYGLAVLSLPLVLALILHFAYRHSTGRVSDQLHHLAEVNRLHLSTIEALAHAIDAKDAVTHGHIRRVQRWAVELASRLGLEDGAELRAIEAAALLHDIGKLAVPEHILNKPGRLTPAEFERMKTHATVGAEILSEVEFPYPVVPIVRHHHENWDGTGYPDGVKGEDIPIGARILSVVDCFDALTSDRPYRRALPAAEAFEIIESRRASMYDPAIVDAFREICAAGLGEAAGPQKQEAERKRLPDVNASPAQAVQDNRDQLLMAMELGVALSSASADDRWRVLAAALRKLPDVEVAAIFIADDRQNCLLPVAVRGVHVAGLEALSITVGERLSGWVAATQQPMINGDAALDLFDLSCLAASRRGIDPLHRRRRDTDCRHLVLDAGRRILPPPSAPRRGGCRGPRICANRAVRHRRTP